MEQQLTYQAQPDSLFDAWDAVPRDGPALFIATCDDGRPVAGTWVRTDQPEHFFRGELALLLNEPLATRDQRDWLVLDQIGIGETMTPERVNLSGLYQLLRQRAELQR